MDSRTFTANLDCPECSVTFEGSWPAAEPDVPDADQECPGCGHVIADAEFPGWSWFGEAG